MPVWKGFSQEWTVGSIQVADSIDPFDKRGYAFAAATGASIERKSSLEPGRSERTRSPLHPPILPPPPTV
jgi:hypothetical protein